MLHTLNDGSQIAVFPIWRNTNVQYYDIGYVRRLVIKLDAEGEVISGNILEMIGNKDYLNTYKEDLPPSFYNGTLQNTGVIAWETEFNAQGFNSQKDAEFDRTCHTSTSISFDDCTLTVSETCPTGGGFTITTVTVIELSALTCSGGGGDSGGGGSNNPPPGGGYTPPTGGGGGTGDGTGSTSNPTNNPPPSEPNPNAPQNPTPVFTDLDGNPTTLDPGDNTIEVPEPEFSEAFEKIVDWSKTNKNDPDIVEIDKEIARLYEESCSFKCMIDQLSAASPDGTPFRMGFQVIENLGTSGVYDPYSQTMKLDFQLIGGRGFSAVIHEELLHSYQDVFDRTYIRNIPPSGLGVPNIEVDAKLMIDIENFRYEISTGNELHQKQRLVNATKKNDAYQKYIETITNNGTMIPNTNAALNTPAFSYADVLNMFKAAYAGKPYDKPIDNDKEPTALIRLAQTCNCN